MTRRTVLDIAHPDTTARSGRLLWRACCAGTEPAEALDPRDREDLVAELVARGWTVRQIAAHCRMTDYTTARIRARVVDAFADLRDAA